MSENKSNADKRTFLISADLSSADAESVAVTQTWKVTIWNILVENEKLKKEIELLTAKRFPIQGGPSIPWAMIEPHRRQCKENHDQTLERIAERHGLDPLEALCVLDDASLRRIMVISQDQVPRRLEEARIELERRRSEYEDPVPRLRAEIERHRRTVDR